jgi:AmiR/NasT family two-component response regulator
MTGRRVLIVHAAVVMRMMISDMLIESGFEVVGGSCERISSPRRLSALSVDFAGIGGS